MPIEIEGSVIEASRFSEAAGRAEMLKTAFGALISGEFADKGEDSSTISNTAIAKIIWEGDTVIPTNSSSKPESNIIIARRKLNDAEARETATAIDLAVQYTKDGEENNGPIDRAVPNRPIRLINRVLNSAEEDTSGKLTISPELLKEKVLPYLESKRADDTTISTEQIIEAALALGETRKAAEVVNRAYKIIEGIKGALQVLYPEYFDLASSTPTMLTPDSGLSREGKINRAPAKLVGALIDSANIRNGWVSASEIGVRIKLHEKNGADIVDPSHFVNALLYQYRRGGPVSEEIADELAKENLQIEYIKIPANKDTGSEEMILYRVVPRPKTQQPSNTEIEKNTARKNANNPRRTAKNATPKIEGTVLSPRSSQVGAAAMTGARRTSKPKTK